jgi:hypothetical protein
MRSSAAWVDKSQRTAALKIVGKNSHRKPPDSRQRGGLNRPEEVSNLKFVARSDQIIWRTAFQPKVFGIQPLFTNSSQDFSPEVWVFIGQETHVSERRHRSGLSTSCQRCLTYIVAKHQSCKRIYNTNVAIFHVRLDRTPCHPIGLWGSAQLADIRARFCESSGNAPDRIFVGAS